MPYLPHGLKTLGSPGYETEKDFNNFLAVEGDKYGINYHIWMSQFKKTPFDFKVFASGKTEYSHRVFYIDVIGYYHQGRRIKLCTHHKDWYELLEYARKDSNTKNPKCYLVFDHYGDWQFLKMTEELSNYDVYLSKSRIKGLRTANTVFNKTEPKKYPLSDRKYLFNRAQDKAVMEWIYSA